MLHNRNMVITTTSNIEGKEIKEYLGLVSGEVIVGANVFKDLFASVRDIVGGRSESYERVLEEARKEALDELEYNADRIMADAVVGVSFDYEAIGRNGSMLMVVIIGTAVKLA